MSALIAWLVAAHVAIAVARLASSPDPHARRWLDRAWWALCPLHMYALFRLFS